MTDFRRPAALSSALLLVAALPALCRAQEAEPLVVSSDPALAERASGLLSDLAARSGMELKEPVRIEKRTRADLVRYLEAKLDEELPEDEARAVVESYALLGLVPPDLDLRGMLLDLYTEQVAGFYEPDSTALFVMDDQPEADLEGLLVHELVHAVQDQTADLDALTDPDLGNDRSAAAQAAIEGHATLVMFEYIAEQQMGSPVDLSRLPDFGPLLRQSLDGVRSQFPALANAPRILQETLIFPYVEGAVYLQGLWAGGERVVPFGENLPLSTEQILVGPGAGPPVELALGVEGGTILHQDVLGRLELGILLEEHLGEDAAGIADGWDGDRYALVAAPDGTHGLVSYVVWEDEAARDRFVEAIGPALDRFGGPTTVTVASGLSRPATVLRIGADGVAVTAREIERR